MLKGHVFSKQIFGHPVFALFVDIFLNKKCGIADYKNNMEISYNSTMLTVSSGVACIRGRFLEEDNYTEIPVGNESGFCKLVIEINLDNINTETAFTQASYKVLKNSSMYPILTQTDIVKNNSGIYQFELAKFKVNSLGITDFEDTRTYIDLDNLYKEFKEEMEKIRNNENVVLKDNFAIISNSVILSENTSANTNYTSTNFEIPYPVDFNKENCVCIAFGTKKYTDTDQYGYNFGTGYTASAEYMIGDFPRRITLNENEIKCSIRNPSSNSFKVYYKIILMKIG